jgi:hypothetical protein
VPLFFWTGLFRIIFILSHFPDGIEKSQSAFSGKLIGLITSMDMLIEVVSKPHLRPNDCVAPQAGFAF